MKYSRLVVLLFLFAVVLVVVVGGREGTKMAERDNAKDDGGRTHIKQPN